MSKWKGKKETDCVEDGEKLPTGVKNPSLRISFTESSDDHELDDSEQKGVRRNREPRRIRFKNRSLKHEPAGPRETVTY